MGIDGIRIQGGLGISGNEGRGMVGQSSYLSHDNQDKNLKTNLNKRIKRNNKICVLEYIQRKGHEGRNLFTKAKKNKRWNLKQLSPTIYLTSTLKPRSPATAPKS